MKDPLPLVSICIPAYNAAHTIEDTLTSLLNQDYPNLNIQIFDNASTDNTVQIIEGFQDDRITIHQNEVNIGVEANFQQCMNKGHGKYTAIYHADDIYETTIVSESVKNLEMNANLNAVSTTALIIDQHNNIKKEFFNPQIGNKTFQILDTIELVKSILRYGNHLITPSFMVRTDIYKKLRHWQQERYGSSADLDVWLRIADTGKIGIINKPLMRYRFSTAQGSFQYNNLRTEPADLFRVLNVWIEKPHIKEKLNSSDHKNLKILINRDKIFCSINASFSGNTDIFNDLLSSTSLQLLIKDSLRCKTGIKYFLLYAALRLSKIAFLKNHIIQLSKKMLVSYYS